LPPQHALELAREELWSLLQKFEATQREHATRLSVLEGNVSELTAEIKTQIPAALQLTDDRLLAFMGGVKKSFQKQEQDAVRDREDMRLLLNRVVRAEFEAKLRDVEARWETRLKENNSLWQHQFGKLSDLLFKAARGTGVPAQPASQMPGVGWVAESFEGPGLRSPLSASVRATRPVDPLPTSAATGGAAAAGAAATTSVATHHLAESGGGHRSNPPRTKYLLYCPGSSSPSTGNVFGSPGGVVGALGGGSMLRQSEASRAGSDSRHGIAASPGSMSVPPSVSGLTFGGRAETRCFSRGPVVSSGAALRGSAAERGHGGTRPGAEGPESKGGADLTPSPTLTGVALAGGAHDTLRWSPYMDGGPRLGSRTQSPSLVSVGPGVGRRSPRDGAGVVCRPGRFQDTEATLLGQSVKSEVSSLLRAGPVNWGLELAPVRAASNSSVSSEVQRRLGGGNRDLSRGREELVGGPVPENDGKVGTDRGTEFSAPERDVTAAAAGQAERLLQGGRPSEPLASQASCGGGPVRDLGASLQRAGSTLRTPGADWVNSLDTGTLKSPTEEHKRGILTLHRPELSGGSTAALSAGARGGISSSGGETVANASSGAEKKASKVANAATVRAQMLPLDVFLHTGDALPVGAVGTVESESSAAVTPASTLGTEAAAQNLAQSIVSDDMLREFLASGKLPGLD